MVAADRPVMVAVERRPAMAAAAAAGRPVMGAASGRRDMVVAVASQDMVVAAPRDMVVINWGMRVIKARRIMTVAVTRDMGVATMTREHFLVSALLGGGFLSLSLMLWLLWIPPRCTTRGLGWSGGI